MVYRAIVLHSPLVGPSTTAPLAAALVDRAWSATAPDLRAGTTAAGFAAVAAHSHGGADVVIGHSGAGAFLPALAAEIGAAATVFVDAVVPGDVGVYLPSPGLVHLLDSLALADGMLPPWHEWWPDGTMEQLVPDERLRRQIEAETPRVARAFFDAPVAFPPFWWRRANAYVQLSPAYATEHERATRWGWPTARLDGQHLDIATGADDVAAVVDRVVHEMLDPVDGTVTGP